MINLKPIVKDILIYKETNLSFWYYTRDKLKTKFFDFIINPSYIGDIENTDTFFDNLIIIDGFRVYKYDTTDKIWNVLNETDLFETKFISPDGKILKIRDISDYIEFKAYKYDFSINTVSSVKFVDENNNTVDMVKYSNLSFFVENNMNDLYFSKYADNTSPSAHIIVNYQYDDNENVYRYNPNVSYPIDDYILIKKEIGNKTFSIIKLHYNFPDDKIKHILLDDINLNILYYQMDLITGDIKKSLLNTLFKIEDKTTNTTANYYFQADLYIRNLTDIYADVKEFSSNQYIFNIYKQLTGMNYYILIDDNCLKNITDIIYKYYNDNNIECRLSPVFETVGNEFLISVKRLVEIPLKYGYLQFEADELLGIHLDISYDIDEDGNIRVIYNDLDYYKVNDYYKKGIEIDNRTNEKYEFDGIIIKHIPKVVNHNGKKYLFLYKLVSSVADMKFDDLLTYEYQDNEGVVRYYLDIYAIDDLGTGNTFIKNKPSITNFI